MTLEGRLGGTGKPPPLPWPSSFCLLCHPRRSLSHESRASGVRIGVRPSSEQVEKGASETGHPSALGLDDSTWRSERLVHGALLRVFPFPPGCVSLPGVLVLDVLLTFSLDCS